MTFDPNQERDASGKFSSGGQPAQPKIMAPRKLVTRRFRDALQGKRCSAVVTLKDGSTADCGRGSVVDGLCTQHKKIKGNA